MVRQRKCLVARPRERVTFVLARASAVLAWALGYRWVAEARAGPDAGPG